MICHYHKTDVEDLALLCRFVITWLLKIVPIELILRLAKAVAICINDLRENLVEAVATKGHYCGIWCFFDVGPHKLLHKQSNDLWFDTTWRSYDVIAMRHHIASSYRHTCLFPQYTYDLLPTRLSEFVLALQYVFWEKYYNMTLWILVGNGNKFSIAAGIIRLHMPVVK